MKKGIMLIFIFCNIIVQGQVNRLVDAKGKEEVIHVCGTLLDIWGTVDIQKVLDGTSPKPAFPEMKKNNNNN